MPLDHHRRISHSEPLTPPPTAAQTSAKPLAKDDQVMAHLYKDFGSMDNPWTTKAAYPRMPEQPPPAQQSSQSKDRHLRSPYVLDDEEEDWELHSYEEAIATKNIQNASKRCATPFCAAELSCLLVSKTFLASAKLVPQKTCLNKVTGQTDRTF